MKKIVAGILLTFTLASATSCKCMKKDGATPKEKMENTIAELKNTTWKLVRFDLENRPFKATDDVAEIQLTFTDEYVSTSDGCNGRSGEFSQEGIKVELGKFMTTMRYCDDEYMEKNGYKIPLEATESFKIEKDQLQLINTSGQVIATYIKVK